MVSEERTVDHYLTTKEVEEVRCRIAAKLEKSFSECSAEIDAIFRAATNRQVSKLDGIIAELKAVHDEIRKLRR